MRFSILLLSLSLAFGALQAQFDGRQFTFQIDELINDQWEQSKVAYLLFNGPNAWFGDEKSFSWISQENYELRNCIDVEGQLIAFTSNRNESTARSLNWTGESKMIHGFKCQQLLVHWEDMKMDAWIYQDTNQSYIPYIAQPGVTLEYVLTTDNFTKRFLADSLTALDKSLLPKNNIAAYQKMNFFEFSDFMKARFMPKLPEQAPAFKTLDLSGEQLNYKGKSKGLLLINFWYTQCPPCIKEIPALNLLKEKYQEASIEFWAITFDQPDLVNSFLKNHPFDFRIIPDAKEVIQSFDVKVYPTSILIDVNGKILQSFMGGDKNTLAELDTLIEQHLN